MRWLVSQLPAATAAGRSAFNSEPGGATMRSGRSEPAHAFEHSLYVLATVMSTPVPERAIVDAGFILQVDDAYLATYYDIIVPPGTIADYRRWAFECAALDLALRQAGGGSGGVSVLTNCAQL